MSVANSPLTVIRRISHYLRKLNPSENITTNAAVQSILAETRKHDVTDERTCRAKEEMVFMGETYAIYLESVANYRELAEIYNKGEATVEEAAAKVGLRLPEKVNP
ncbi:protein FMC1 homolog [Tetranychus urticae]|uniref:Protein FMC1 homolog n=1 Tax=Tetranychus urticae TaxID=32264 RepID=T1KNA0_TETUR|nr:protein FMC1 homolog [Tetranychus urticae]